MTSFRPSELAIRPEPKPGSLTINHTDLYYTANLQYCMTIL